MKRVSFVVALICATTAWARAEGVADVGCQGCHPGQDAVTTTLTSSNDHPSPGETVTLTVRITGPGSVGGLYLRSGRVGTFTPLDAATRLIGGELVHVEPAAATAGVVTFRVSYRATQEISGADLEVFTVMANDNRQGGDDTASYAALSLGWGCDAGVLYRDSDGDGVGSAESGTSRRCGLGFGWSASDTDCDDRNGSIRPGAQEQCNGLDDDCDGTPDEGLESIVTWRDADGDGFGSTDGGTGMCGLGRVTNANDCDDSRGAVKPGATEVCNGRDDDCDGVADGAQCVPACVPRTETCNGRDDDCDEEVDEGGVCAEPEPQPGCACGSGDPLLLLVLLTLRKRVPSLPVGERDRVRAQ